MSLLPKQVLGKNISNYILKPGLPELKGLEYCYHRIHEYRNSFFANTQYDVNQFRKEFYGYIPGNWSVKIADLRRFT